MSILLLRIDNLIVLSGNISIPTIKRKTKVTLVRVQCQNKEIECISNKTVIGNVSIGNAIGEKAVHQKSDNHSRAEKR